VLIARLTVIDDKPATRATSSSVGARGGCGREILGVVTQYQPVLKSISAIIHQAARLIHTLLCPRRAETVIDCTNYPLLYSSGLMVEL
jgi:hypothetical protein